MRFAIIDFDELKEMERKRESLSQKEKGEGVRGKGRSWRKWEGAVTEREKDDGEDELGRGVSFKIKKVMDTYAINLVIAALLGASFVAVSAYYMHCKTLSQLLEFAKAVERERERNDGEDELGRGDSPQHFNRYTEKRQSHNRRSISSSDSLI